MLSRGSNETAPNQACSRISEKKNTTKAPVSSAAKNQKQHERTKTKDTTKTAALKMPVSVDVINAITMKPRAARAIPKLQTRVVGVRFSADSALVAVVPVLILTFHAR